MSNERFEIKFPMSELHLARVYAWLMEHAFRELYSSRRVSNIYFDTFDYGDASDNLIGLSKRRKMRLRWYDACHNSMTLEWKLKNNRVGDKRSWALLCNEDISNLEVWRYLDRVKADSSLPFEVMSDIRWENPVLFNTYQRCYYMSSDDRVRVTIDSDISFSKVDKNVKFSSLKGDFPHSYVVVEMKSNIDDASALKSCINRFPYAHQRHSKYLAGIARYMSIPYF